jgi:subtilisin family serine protease
VVCVIDDGIQSTHPDIAPNLWVNEAEIPNNGIDDDDNGFVDDYRGWDTGANTDAVYDGGGHGTPVAGIVGAKGNNGIGVSGVNWDVKLMIVQGGTGVESEVLEAYSYPLTMRLMYNESNGEEGAFVVSTNASWGVDFGQPADAPLWCAFYDELGEAGILSCGATINGNQNVDVVGDLPTACPSEYLISVTNMNRNDIKVTGAGYGLETIDLGAFGQDTWTTNGFGGYSGFGGTSGATPHVSGIIALMYSLPCPELMSLAQADPAAAAALVRDAIFEGVDPNESLEGITTTGGRLNAFNTAQLLLSTCGPCPPPYGISISGITDMDAIIDYTVSDSTLSAMMQIRPVGTTEWTTIDNLSNPHTLTGLLACTEYEFQLMSSCASEMSDWSPTFSFQTDGCCENPELFEVVNIENELITVSWSSVLAADFYNLQIAVEGTENWISYPETSGTILDINGLNACTDYEIQIQVSCDGVLVPWSESIFVTTTGCGACTDLTYCEMDGGNTEEEWISSVTIDGTSNESSAGPDAYENFTVDGSFMELALSGEYEIELAPDFAGTSYSEGFAVYIDFNQDGVFSTSEEVFNSDPSSSAATGTIVIADDALLGLTRMRVIMAYNATPDDPCDLNSQWGETEDYCVTIIGPLGLNELDGLDQWTLRPNPATAELQIDLQWMETASVIEVALIDLRGQVIRKEQYNPASGALLTWDISALADGVYMIRLQDKNGQQAVKRLIKQ